MYFMNYHILVNQENPYQLGMAKELEISFTYFSNAFDKPCLLETTTYQQFQKLKEYVYQTENIKIDVEDGYRSFQEQKIIFEEMKLQYGEAYAKQYVAKSGTSEHHTGLAIDMTIEVEGNFLCDNHMMEKHKEKYYQIYPYLSRFGFILRYPEGKEEITGYPSELWHIRYVGEPLASYLSSHYLTLEEYEKEKNISQ